MIVSDKRANDYLTSILHNVRFFKDDLEAVILFGSHARGGETIFSDVDVLIVLKQRNKIVINRIIKMMRYLEIQYNYSRKPCNKLDMFLNYLNIATGMFRSWFICTKEDLIDQNFSKITGTNKIIGKIFVPSKLILFNIKREGKIIFGNPNILKKIFQPQKIERQAIRSFFLNEIIAICALFITPFTKTSIFYSLESIKWSLFLIDELKLTEKILEKNLRRNYDFYKKIKSSGIFDPFLCILAPILVLKLHLLAFHKLEKIKTQK